MRRRDPFWRTRFGSFVSNYGNGGAEAEVSGVPRLVMDLSERGVSLSKQTVYHWLSGATSPRPHVAEVLRDLSGGQLTLDAIFEHRREVATGGASDGPAKGPDVRDRTT